METTRGTLKLTGYVHENSRVIERHAVSSQHQEPILLVCSSSLYVVVTVGIPSLYTLLTAHTVAKLVVCANLSGQAVPLDPG